MEDKKVTCSQCNREYIRPKSCRSKFNFCSKECKYLYIKKYKTLAKTVELICPVCNKLFFKEHRFVIEGRIHCCSRSCAASYNNKKENNVYCATCGIPFHKKPSRVSKNNFCSKKCQLEFISKNIPSEEKIIELHKNGMYDKDIAEFYNCSDGAISKKIKIYLKANNEYIDRRSKKNNIELKNRIAASLRVYYNLEVTNEELYKVIYKEARKIFDKISFIIKAKKDFKCEICGKRGGELHAHHIKEFSAIIKDFTDKIYQKENGSIAYQLTNYKPYMDESNLMVLCRSCHYIKHKKIDFIKRH